MPTNKTMSPILTNTATDLPIGWGDFNLFDDNTDSTNSFNNNDLISFSAISNNNNKASRASEEFIDNSDYYDALIFRGLTKDYSPKLKPAAR